MKSLILIRHATAADFGSGPDRERPLTEEGTQDAQDQGEWLANKGAVFDRVLCSTAVRTRETAEFAGLSVTHYLDAIYEASVGELIRLLESHSDADHIALVGHNPGIAGVAGFVTGHRQVMTPGTIIGIAFEPEVRGSLQPQSGLIRLYHPPAR